MYCAVCKLSYPNSERFCARCGQALSQQTFWQQWGVAVVVGGVVVFVGSLLILLAALGSLTPPKPTTVASTVGNAPSANNARPKETIATPTPTPREEPKVVAMRDVKLKLNSWKKGGFDSIMLVNLTIENPTEYSVKDVSITCTHYAPSGTEIDSNSRTVYEVVPAKGRKAIREFNMGFIHSQASTTNCEIRDLEVMGL